MKTDNELIAKFDSGIEFDETGQCTDKEQQYSWRPGSYQPLRISHLQYDTEWGWLMPVIDKIRSKWGNDVILNGDLTVIKKTKGFKTKGFKKIEVLESGSIQSAYKAVLLYIEWYNKQPIKK